MNSVISKIVEFLKYPSTWSGAVKLISGAFGATISTDLTTQIVALGVAAAGIIGILFSDADVKPTPTV